MRLRWLGVVLLIGGVGASNALAAPSATRAGCPVITKAQATAALGNVQKIVQHTQRTVGVGGKSVVTSLLQCDIHFRDGVVNIVFSPGDDRQTFDEARRSYAAVGKVTTVSGLGKAAFLVTSDPSDPRRELYVFHPSRISPPKGIPAPRGPGTGAFAVLPSGARLPVRSLIALARAVLKHPIRPLESPKR